MSQVELHQPHKAKPASLIERIAAKYHVDPQKMLSTLKETAFKGNVTNEQMLALLVVADQYDLNPWLKQIYAFPDKGGIVPVVGVDGWARIINQHPQFDGMTFTADAESCTCSIYRKDRTHAIVVTEFMRECKRDTQPWKSHPQRMLRHKAMIQCARLAFGFAGIYDEDEAERVRYMGAAEEVPSSLSSVRSAVAAKRTATETVDAETGEIVGGATDTRKADEHADFIGEMDAAEGVQQ
jgi:phage recombination protein Bet